jgi:hypothetical protein
MSHYGLGGVDQYAVQVEEDGRDCELHASTLSLNVLRL